MLRSGGRLLGLLALMTQVGDMISCGIHGAWSQKACQIFTVLPFYPGQSPFDLTGENDSEKSKREKMGESSRPSKPKSLGLIVNIHVIKAPEEALAQLNGTSKDQSLCQLVLLKVTADLLGT